jgi:hypothetical protein
MERTVGTRRCCYGVRVDLQPHPRQHSTHLRAVRGDSGSPACSFLARLVLKLDLKVEVRER